MVLDIGLDRGGLLTELLAQALVKRHRRPPPEVAEAACDRDGGAPAPSTPSSRGSPRPRPPADPRSNGARSPPAASQAGGGSRLARRTAKMKPPQRTAGA